MGKEVSSFGNSKFKKNLITFNVIVIILIATYFIISSLLHQFIVSLLCSDQAIYIDNNNISNTSRDFSYYSKDEIDTFKEVFTAKIYKSSIDRIGEEELEIFTPNMQSEAYEIYINDILIATEGDNETYNSSIWTNSFSYTVGSDIFDREINELKIVQYSRYMGGSKELTFMIDGYQGSIMLRNMNMLDIHQGIVGIAFGLIFLILLMIVLMPSRKKVYYLLLSTLSLMIIGYLEYYEIHSIGFEFLIFKKIVITAALLSIGIATAIFHDFFVDRRHTFMIVAVFFIVIIVPTLFMQNMIIYKKLYTVLTILVLPIVVYWGFVAVRNYKKYEEGKIVLSIAVVSVIYVALWTLSESTGIFYLPSMIIIMLPIFIVFSITLILIDIYELRLNVATTKIKYKAAYKKSIIDGLTGLYNSKHTKDVMNAMIGPFVVVMIDIDNFKRINDNYGHLAGDKALIFISKTISGMLRDDDFLGRYGGDEFTCILKIDNVQDAKKILERIRKKIEGEELIFEENSIKLTISTGFYIAQGNESFEYLLAKADKALYQAKNGGKNKVCNLENYTDEDIIFNDSNK